jgi:RNA polymerase sigma factor (TIGR02999 family)
MPDVTQQLDSVHPDGQRPTSEELLPLVYDELRKLAAARLAQENPGQTLQATALVHEAYLRLGGGQANSTWQSRAHFFGAAAEAMRRILIDAARRKGRQKRGGDQHRIDFRLVEPAVEDANFDLLALNDALSEFSERDPVKAELVKLRYFAGLTLDEAAATLEISTATADRYWKYARAWLAARLADAEPSTAEPQPAR